MLLTSRNTCDSIQLQQSKAQSNVESTLKISYLKLKSRAAEEIHSSKEI